MLFETDQRAALDQLNALLQHLPSNALQGDRRLVLEQLISSSINAGRKEDALKFNDDLKVFGNRFHDARALALASNFEARMLQNDGKVDEAAIEIERALSLSQDANDKEVAFRVNLMAGTININLGNFNSALHYQLAALGAIDGNDVESRLKRSAAMYMITKLYLALKNPQLSLEYNAKARALTEQTNVPRTIVALAISRGDAHAAMNNKREAEKAYTEALSLARKISDRRQEAAALGSLADLAKQAARYADCASYALQAESVAEEAHIDSVKADAEISLGLCNIGLGSARQGREEIDRGMAFFRKASAKPELELALGQLADAYVKVGKFREAVDALREQRTLAAELFQADRDRATSK
jgi:tetratricopeptide (TPR) repeat protein